MTKDDNEELLTEEWLQKRRLKYIAEPLNLFCVRVFGVMILVKTRGDVKRLQESSRSSSRLSKEIRNHIHGRTDTDRS